MFEPDGDQRAMFNPLIIDFSGKADRASFLGDGRIDDVPWEVYSGVNMVTTPSDNLMDDHSQGHDYVKSADIRMHPIEASGRHLIDFCFSTVNPQGFACSES